MDIFQYHVWPRLKTTFLVLISKRTYLEKFEGEHEKPEFQFLPEKCHLCLVTQKELEEVKLTVLYKDQEWIG